MAKRKPDDPVQSALDQLFSVSEQAWLEYDTAARAILESEVRRFKTLKWDEIQDRLRRRLDDLSRDFSSQIGVDSEYVQAYQQDLFLPPPPTVMGATVTTAMRLAQEQYQVMLPRADFMMSQQLVLSTEAIHSMQSSKHETFFKEFRDITGRIDNWSKGDDLRIYEDVIETLMDRFGYQDNLGLATTVMQGTYMGTYRGYGAEVAAEIGTENALFTGPSPASGRRGHEFCQAHYGEVHTPDEWLEIALNTDQLLQIAADRGESVTLDSLWRWGGGYGCKHHWRFNVNPELGY